MKQTVIDRVVGYFNPKAGFERLRSRAGIDMMKRAYDVAGNKGGNGNWRRPKSSGAQEVSQAYEIGAATGQELCRNNPDAKRAKRVMAASMVGTGIRPEIISRKKKISKVRLKQINDDYNDWADSIECDFEGFHTLYGLQFLWASTIVESGGVFIRKHINNTLVNPLQLQTFEQSHLDRSKSTISDSDTGIDIIDGFEYKDGVLRGYWLFTQPSEMIRFNRHSMESKFYPVEEVVHIFLKERSGQHLGVTWFDASAGTLRNQDILDEALLMQQQIAACFGVVISEGQKPVGLGDGTGAVGRPDELEPGMIEYVKDGTEINTITPPKADNSEGFYNKMQRKIASGIGVTYEQLTGNYSQVNFASGRMGKTEFHTQLDVFQHIMLKPALDKIFNWFLMTDTLMQGGKGKQVDNKVFKADWTFPPRASVEPGAEFDLLMKKVRNGMLSPRKAAKQLGELLPDVVAQWVEDKELFGELPFDLDPSKFSSAGNQLDENDAAASNNNNKDGDDPKSGKAQKKKEIDSK